MCSDSLSLVKRHNIFITNKQNHLCGVFFLGSLKFSFIFSQPKQVNKEKKKSKRYILPHLSVEKMGKEQEDKNVPSIKSNKRFGVKI